MKVKEVIEALQKLNPDADVGMMSDYEGSTTHQLAAIVPAEKDLIWFAPSEEKF